MVKPDGTFFWVQLTATTARADDGAPACLFVLCDISGLKQVEAARQESAMQLEESVRAAHVGLWDWDLSTHRVHYSREWKLQVGCTEEEIGDSFEEWEKRVHPRDLAPTLEKCREAIDGESQRYQTEFRFRHKDGSYRWILAQCFVFRDESGKAQRVVGSHLDLTEFKRAEEAARREQAFSQTIIDSIPGTFYVVDDRGGYVRWNTYQRDEIIGRPEEEIAGYSALETIHPDDRELIKERIANVLEHGMDETVEGRVLLRGGPAFRWFLMTGRRMMVDDRAFLVGIGVDITERKQAEEAMRGSEARFRFLVDYSYDLIWTLKADNILGYASPSWKSMLGYEPSDIVGTAFQPLVHPDDLAACEEYVAKVFEARTALPGPDYRVRHADGSWQWHEVSMTPVFSQDGSFVSFVGVSRDITMRKLAEAALKASELRFKELLRNVGTVAVQGYAMDGTVHYWNRASESFYGYTAEEAHGQNLLDLIIPSGMRDSVREAIHRIVETGVVFPTSELELMRKDGSPIPVYSSHALVQLPGEEPELFCIDIDLTELKKTEAERNKLQAQFLQAQKMESVGRLAGGVAEVVPLFRPRGSLFKLA